MRLIAILAVFLLSAQPLAAAESEQGRVLSLNDNHSGIYPPYSAYKYAKLMTPRDQAFYFFGLVDVFMHFDRARKVGEGMAKCNGPVVNWLKASIMFDSYIENPKFWGATHKVEDIKNLTAIELLGPFLDKYCGEFDLQ